MVAGGSALACSGGRIADTAPPVADASARSLDDASADAEGGASQVPATGQVGVEVSVAPGEGYVVSATVTTADGSGCTGQSLPVSVVARQTAEALVPIPSCSPNMITTTRPSPCPVWGTIVANPPRAGLPPNEQSTVTVVAQGPEPAAMTFSFGVIAGTGTLGDQKTVFDAGDAGSGMVYAIGYATFTCPPEASRTSSRSSSATGRSTAPRVRRATRRGPSR